MYILRIYYTPDTVLGTAAVIQVRIHELKKLMRVQGWERKTDGKMNKNSIE